MLEYRLIGDFHISRFIFILLDIGRFIFILLDISRFIFVLPDIGRLWFFPLLTYRSLLFLLSPDEEV